MFKSTLIPENVPGLNPVRINEILYQKLSYRVKINDQMLRGINTYITRGLGPFVSVLDRILQFENLMKKNVDIKIYGKDLVLESGRDSKEELKF